MAPYLTPYVMKSNCVIELNLRKENKREIKKKKPTLVLGQGKGKSKRVKEVNGTTEALKTCATIGALTMGTDKSR